MEAKKGYLFAYNSTLCAAWAYVFAKMCQTLFVDNLGVYSVWENVDSALKVAQTAALLEVVHAAVGLVRSPVFITATQVASRIWILWGIICLDPESTTKTSVQIRLPLVDHQLSLNIVTLLTAWCLSEVIRYGFFACKEANSQPKFLVWLRYSGFLVLYPLGVSSELAMVWLALPSLKANKTWSIELPNPFNFGFSYYYGCIVGVALYLPGFPKLYSYMLSQRSKVLGKARLRKKTE